MKYFPRAIALIGLAILAIGAASPPDADALLRLANTAFANEDYASAVELYTRAEDMTTDPGLITFNKAASLYKLGKYREAELHYQRCLEEATGRRSSIYYNLGNCLLQQAQAGGDIKMFRQAIDSYTLCLAEASVEAPLAENARHNLELAKLLWLQARLNRSEEPEGEQGNESKPDPPQPEKPMNETTKNGGTDTSTGAAPKPDDKGSKVDDKGTQQAPIETPQQVPGSGNLKPPSDDKQLTPLPPEDALRHLQDAAQRVHRERSAYRLRSAPPLPRELPNW